MKYKIENQTIENATIYMVIIDDGIMFYLEPKEGFYLVEKDVENPDKVVAISIPESRKNEINNYIAVKKEGRQDVHDFERNSI